MNLQRLRSLRVLKSLNMHEFAEKVDIKYSTYCTREQGKTELTLSEAKRIADFLGMTIEDVFY